MRAMAGSYYVKATAKVLLDIASADTADDTLLDALGTLADQHIDNILKKHDEKIPLQSTNVLNDIIMAANFYTCSLYKGRRGHLDEAKFWEDKFTETISGITEERSIEGNNYIAERFNARLTNADVFSLWS